MEVTRGAHPFHGIHLAVLCMRAQRRGRMEPGVGGRVGGEGGARTWTVASSKFFDHSLQSEIALISHHSTPTFILQAHV